MNARQLVYDTFIAPFYQKDRCCVGVELEFPLLATGDEPVSEDIGLLLLAYLQKHGFSVAETDIYGRGVFITNADGDCLSFDNAYQNFEFAMTKDEDLTAVAARFYTLYDLVQDYLQKIGYTLTGLGTNPHRPHTTSRPVAYPIYMTLCRFLSNFSGGFYHTVTDFPAWLSSVQTHLDVSADRLPQAYTVYAALDFVRALLFSNALPFSNLNGFSKTICFRDYLWEHSGFGSLADNTGPVCGTFQTTDDLINMFMKKSIFLSVSAKGDYQIIPAAPLEEYCNTIGTSAALNGYLSFKNVEITRRGTLEVRSDCAQPVAEAFAPSAFNLGILQNLDDAAQRLDAFFAWLPPELADTPDRNAQLRRRAIYGEGLPVSDDVLRTFLLDLVRLAERGLVQRGLGEEALLKPLFARAETLSCPALVTRRRLQSGELWADIICDYANPHYSLGDDLH